jgi:hypothetical protein
MIEHGSQITESGPFHFFHQIASGTATRLPRRTQDIDWTL